MCILISRFPKEYMYGVQESKQKVIKLSLFENFFFFAKICKVNSHRDFAPPYASSSTRNLFWLPQINGERKTRQDRQKLSSITCCKPTGHWVFITQALKLLGSIAGTQTLRKPIEFEKQ